MTRAGLGKMGEKENLFGDHVVSISRLHLDPKNPRHEPLESDSEIIAELVNKQWVRELAADIARRGALNPLEVMGVIPYDGVPGHFIMMEGNRRTCALILLADPLRAPTVELQAQFKKLAEKNNVPREIKVHVFKDRKSAKPWVDMRHMGFQGGVGTREWDAPSKTRAVGDNMKTTSRANTLALAVLDRLTQRRLLTKEQRDKVSLTTITRYLGTPGVRAILGLGSSSELIYTHEADEVDAALQRLVLDSIEPQADHTFIVNSRSGSADRLSYANSLKQKGNAPVSPLSEPAAPPEKLVASRVKPASKSQVARSSTHPNKRQTLYSNSFVVKSRDPVLRRLREEAVCLEIEEFAFSANYLLRSLVEQVMILFLKKRGKYGVNMSDQILTQTCMEELKAAGVTGKPLTVVSKSAGSAATPYSLHSLGNAVHGGSIPTKKDLIAYADTWEPALNAMMEVL